MSDLLIKDTSLTAIGDSIRSKLGTTNLYKVGDMPTAIESISGGSGCEIVFYDIGDDIYKGLQLEDKSVYCFKFRNNNTDYYIKNDLTYTDSPNDIYSVCYEDCCFIYELEKGNYGYLKTYSTNKYLSVVDGSLILTDDKTTYWQIAPDTDTGMTSIVSGYYTDTERYYIYNGTSSLKVEAYSGTAFGFYFYSTMKYTRDELKTTSLTIKSNGTYRVNKNEYDGYYKVSAFVPVEGITASGLADGTQPSGAIEGSATKIVDYAFMNRSAITSCSFPNATSIGTYAFKGCSSMTSANLPSISGTIGSYAFNGCSSLTSFSAPNATRINTYAFQDCQALTSLNLPSTTYTEGYAFSGCIKLPSIELPSCTNIGTYAFNLNYLLEKVICPKATTIGTYCFYNCRSLKVVDFQNYQGKTATTGGATFYTVFTSSGNYRVLESLEFVAMQNLTNGFRQTTSTYAIFLATPTNTVNLLFDMTTPPTLSSVLAIGSDEVRAKVRILVPAEALITWQAATNWSSLTIDSIENHPEVADYGVDWVNEKYFGG